MRIAVALATYDGARWLEPQLRSLARQIRKPDALVIADDGSTDATLELCRAFARRAAFPVRILEPAEGAPLGPMGNFARAAAACDAPLIAFCDQDDVWSPTKLENCVAAMASTTARLCVHSLTHFRQVGRRRVVRVTRWREGEIDGLNFPPHRPALGMSLVVRRSLLAEAAAIGAAWAPRFDAIAAARPVCLMDHWSHAHDLALLTAARLLGPLRLIGRPLAAQRLHGANYSEVGGGAWRQDARVARGGPQGAVRTPLLLAAFCGDFADWLASPAAAGLLPPPRRAAAIAAYERWARIWRGRARLSDPAARLPQRLGAFGEAAAQGAYRGRLAGGLGARALARDALACAGLAR